METVKVRKVDLIQRIEENRAKHRSIFEDACAGYREAAIRELDRSLADAKAGRKIRQFLELVEPVDHTDDYDAILEMLRFSVDDVIELDARSFNQYMRDQWRWREQFVLSNSNYTNVNR